MKGKVITFLAVIVALALSAFVYFKFYFVFGEGVKAGELNFVVHKGYVFKTYEGRVIQAGFSHMNSTSRSQTRRSPTHSCVAAARPLNSDTRSTSALYLGEESRSTLLTE